MVHSSLSSWSLIVLVWCTTLLAIVPDCTSLGTSSSKNNVAEKLNNKITQPPQEQTEIFSIPLVNSRPKPSTFVETLKQLWNDPRPVSGLINDAFASASETETSATDTFSEKKNSIPYCILSDEFEVASERFCVLLYPRGRFVGESEATSSSKRAGPAAAYLRYIPKTYGDECDVAWKLRLIDERSGEALPIFTSGGLPKSNDTWSAAMTFCSETEDIESIGRAADWGASTWYSQNVCDILGHIRAEGEITVFQRRSGESSFLFPPKGALGAVLSSASDAAQPGERNFRVGEVIVPMPLEKDNPPLQAALDASFIVAGTDYRIMTMTDKEGNPIFSTESLPPEERSQARLALRPTGWKTQRQQWQKRGMKTEWPVECEARYLSKSALTRFNPAASFPRFFATFQRDAISILVAIAFALAPLPLALIGRNFVSLYAIPSASMDPTLQKGDVLLVEKLPGIFERTKRGDIVLFNPPSALREIVGKSGTTIRGDSLFVKRVAGMPGDNNIIMDEVSEEITIDGKPAAGPDRNLCDDEPLRLIKPLLRDGKGKAIEKLGENDVYVLGDCKDVSVDSRVFGVLPKSNIVGKPVARVWPLSRIFFGQL